MKVGVGDVSGIAPRKNRYEALDRALPERNGSVRRGRDPRDQLPATPAVAATPTVPADAISIKPQTGSNSSIAVSLDAGSSAQQSVVVTNRTSDLRLQVSLTATDAAGSIGSGTSAWVAFQSQTVQVDPSSSTNVPVTVAVPHDTQPGPALAHIVATVVGAQTAANSNPVAGTANASLPLSIQVQGTTTAQIAIADVRRVDHGSTHQLSMIFRNFGNQGTAVTGSVPRRW